MKSKMLYLLIGLALHAIGSVYAADPERKIAQEAKVLVEDIVYKVLPKGGDYKVLFQRHSGVYYLKGNAKNFKAIQSALEESSKSGDSIKIKADPTTLEIEELVLESR